jgi:enoyl-CoA hydratase/carnithine racemase
MAYETIRSAVENRIQTITLSRPDKLNAFTGPMMQDLIAAFDAADKNDDVRAAIVAGAGRAFRVSADLRRCRHVRSR